MNVFPWPGIIEDLFVLVQFVVENFRSFRDEAVLSMRSPEGSSRADGGLHTETEDGQILRAAVLYGANASGKSNFVEAIRFAQMLITEDRSTKDPLPYHPFKLDSECSRQPSRFEFVFVCDDTLNSYGFTVDGVRVLSEWLFRGSEQHEKMLFERVFDTETGEYQFQVGDALVPDGERRQFYKFLHTGTPAKRLFLREGGERNATELDAVLRWFNEQLAIIHPGATFGGLVSLVCEDEPFRRFLSDLLARVDTGVLHINHRRSTLDLSGVPEGVEQRLREMFRDQGVKELEFVDDAMSLKINEAGQIERIRLVLEHQGEQSTVELDIGDESDGTLRLMHLGPVLFPSSNNMSCTYVIDELERSLHPLITQMFMQEFLSTRSERPNQLVCTTHNTNLLDVDLLVPEAIWFVEKNQRGASHLYSLLDFDQSQLEVLRNDLQQGYLAGRFGGIPFLGSIARVITEESGKTGWVNRDDFGLLIS